MSSLRHAAWCVVCVLLAHGAYAQTPYDRPWDNPAVPIVLDPYGENDIDWDKAVTDQRLKAIIHKASDGADTDSKFVARAAEAKKRGLLYGGYHLGRPGDPIAQADLLLNLAEKTGAKFLALDLEGTSAKFMSLANAVKFLEHVQAMTGRYPAVYVNKSVYEAISSAYDKSSAFAKGPLWIARFQPTLDIANKKVWDDYTFWQFSSEINCKPSQACLYRVPGTKSDMDVNVFNGDMAALRKLFE